MGGVEDPDLDAVYGSRLKIAAKMGTSLDRWDVNGLLIAPLKLTLDDVEQ
jgi:hypothetical protein